LFKGKLTELILGGLSVMKITKVVITYDRNITISAIEPITLLLVDTSLALGVGRNENKSTIANFFTHLGCCSS